MNKTQHCKTTLSLWGIGPKYVLFSLCCSGIAALISWQSPQHYRLEHGTLFFEITGLACFAFGFYLWLSAATIIDRHILNRKLITTGVYGIVRNPIYSGILFMLLGIFVFLKAWLLILSIIPNTLVLLRLLKREEKILERAFGHSYLKYKQQVGSIFPRIHLKR